MRIALTEFDTAWEDPAANRARIAETLPEADVVVLPETAFTGFSTGASPDPDAEPFLQALAKERGRAIVGGYVGAGPSNVAVAVGTIGEVLARYTKVHTFTYAGESDTFKSGDKYVVPVFGLGGLQCAMQVCYDLRFPGAFRYATLTGGAQLFFVIANWPDTRIQHWHTLLRARAIENQAYVIGVNRIGKDPNVSYVSSSTAIDPMGEVLLEGPGVVEVDPARVEQVRSDFPFLKDAR